MDENSGKKKRGRKPLTEEERSARQEPCLICGDSSTGLHYGVRSCEGCKGFFKRTIQMERQYNCRNENVCDIVKGTRNTCQACRLKKCFDQGMQASLVRFDRTPGNRRKIYLSHGNHCDVMEQQLLEQSDMAYSSETRRLRVEAQDLECPADNKDFLKFALDPVHRLGRPRSSSSSEINAVGQESREVHKQLASSINVKLESTTSSDPFSYKFASTSQYPSVYNGRQRTSPSKGNNKIKPKSNSQRGRKHGDNSSGFHFHLDGPYQTEEGALLEAPSLAQHYYSPFSSNKSSSVHHSHHPVQNNDNRPNDSTTHVNGAVLSTSGCGADADDPDGAVVVGMEFDDYNLSNLDSFLSNDYYETNCADPVLSTVDGNTVTYKEESDLFQDYHALQQQSVNIGVPMHALDEEYLTLIAEIQRAEPNFMPNYQSFSGIMSAQEYFDATMLEVEQIIVFARKVPGFLGLSLHDRKILISYSFLSIQVVRLAFRSVHEDEDTFRFSSHHLFNSESLLAVSDFPSTIVKLLKELLQWFYFLQINEIECGLLQVLLLANDVLEGLEDQISVYNIQRRALMALNNYSSSRYPQEPQRAGLLLLRLPAAQKLAMLCGESILQRVDYGFLHIGPLANELFADRRPFLSSSASTPCKVGSMLTNFLEEQRGSAKEANNSIRRSTYGDIVLSCKINK